MDAKEPLPQEGTLSANAEYGSRDEHANWRNGRAGGIFPFGGRCGQASGNAFS